MNDKKRIIHDLKLDFIKRNNLAIKYKRNKWIIDEAAKKQQEKEHLCKVLASDPDELEAYIKKKFPACNVKVLDIDNMTEEEISTMFLDD